MSYGSLSSSSSRSGNKSALLPLVLFLLLIAGYVLVLPGIHILPGYFLPYILLLFALSLLASFLYAGRSKTAGVLLKIQLIFLAISCVNFYFYRDDRKEQEKLMRAQYESLQQSLNRNIQYKEQIKQRDMLLTDIPGTPRDGVVALVYSNTPPAYLRHRKWREYCYAVGAITPFDGTPDTVDKEFSNIFDIEMTYARGEYYGLFFLTEARTIHSQMSVHRERPELKILRPEKTDGTNIPFTYTKESFKKESRGRTLTTETFMGLESEAGYKVSPACLGTGYWQKTDKPKNHAEAAPEFR